MVLLLLGCSVLCARCSVLCLVLPVLVENRAAAAAAAAAAVCLVLVLGAGCLVLGARCCVLGAGCSVLCAWCRVSRAPCWDTFARKCSGKAPLLPEIMFCTSFCCAGHFQRGHFEPLHTFTFTLGCHLPTLTHPGPRSPIEQRTCAHTRTHMHTNRLCGAFCPPLPVHPCAPSGRGGSIHTKKKPAGLFVPLPR